MKIGIGIDTGGTCTDAVAFDLDANTLLAKGKSLTTREDLSIGIGNALDKLPAELVRDAAIISLSTTLATNACVENKGCRAKLLIFGLTDELMERYKVDQRYGLRLDSVRCVETHGSADGFVIDEPDWDAVFSELGEWLGDADALAIAELYSTTNGAPCEKRAVLLLDERFNKPCIGASELSGELDVIARGATALLNARLLPIVREFVDAALSDLALRECNAPVMIVRSDGGLMSASRSLVRPVETILSGPAASVLAGKNTVLGDDYIIIDMGGTTTDVSVVQDGRPTMANQGISIGGWRTHVKGVFVDTFALGGDSAVRMEGDFPRLFPRRITPLCVAAERWPEIKDKLQELLNREHTNMFPLHEFFYLLKKPESPARYDKYERELIAALECGPELLARLNDTKVVDVYHLDSERLESEGIIMRCGLTPTDFMHISGDYNEFDTESSRLAARYMLRCLKRDDTESELRRLSVEIYELVGGRMYENLVRIMLQLQYPAKYTNGLDLHLEHLIREAWALRNDSAALTRTAFSTKVTLVGVGAPTYVFLPEVARALGTGCVVPEDAEVANALGALNARISAMCRIEISQRLGDDGSSFYIAHLPDGSTRFDELDDAIKVAKAAAEKQAIKEARSRGAHGEIVISTSAKRDTTLSRWGNEVKLGCTVLSEVMEQK